MPPPPHSRPENVLKRAQELIGVGQSQAALSILHEHVVSKRTRNNPISSLEPVMLLFVQLCVDLRKGKLAKDGLYQYKNTAQNTNVGTIQLVFKTFIQLAEAKVTEAQAKADEVQSTIETTTTSNVDDLEASENPESILLSAVSSEQSKDRTDRAIVTPWLKFLWETYRTVLDIFKNNSRLEIMYQSTAHQAFQFCSKYQRKTEFRRLCELLRNHLQNVAKFSAQMHAINLNDPDTLQRHLDTRFQQLNVAVELELWQEAFRSVEDVHTQLSMSKRSAKPVMMANYFEKLTRIFMVSDNHLFHAAAWSRYYNLLRQSSVAISQGASKKEHPSVSDADMTKAASFVLLSALSIPVISTSRSRGALVDVDEAKKSKNVRLTNLLGMSSSPSRSILFNDAISKGLLRRCRPEIRELYNILEVDFHPLSICKRISPILTQIGAEPEMAKYVYPLQQVILTRLFQQLSQVYESVQLEFILSLAQFPDPFQVSSSYIQKFIMNGCKKGDLAIRYDDAAGILTFDSDVFSSAKALHPGAGAGFSESDAPAVQRLQSTPAEIVRSQLTRLAKSLYITCQYVDPTFNEERNRTKAEALQRAKLGAEKERTDVLARREVIERKKAAASTALAQKEKDLATQKRIKDQERHEKEAQRLLEEQRERERRRLEAERNRVQQEEAQKALEELKRGTKGIDIDLDKIDVAQLDTVSIRAIKIRALEREKTELAEKLRLTARRLDHMERALRLEEVKHLPEDEAAQLKRDREAWEEDRVETLKEAEEKHRNEVALKHRLGRLLSTYEGFRKDIQSQRQSEFEKRKKRAQQELENKMEARRREVRERKARERREQEEAERRQREEEERVQREEEERIAAEEETRRKLAEEKAAREEERRRLDEKLAKQRAQEEKAEAKLAAKRAERDLGPRIPSHDRTGRTVSAVGGDHGPDRGLLMRGTSPFEQPARSGTPTSSVGGDAPPPGRRPLALQSRGGGAAAPGWREREAARKAALAAQSGGESGGEGVSHGAGARDGEREREGREPPAEGGRYRPGMFAGRREDRPDREVGSRREVDREPRREMERERPPRSAPPRREEEEEPPAEGKTEGKTDGKYRPGMFSKIKKTF